ncbi:MAG: hypothetical protein KatS3mg102_0165 [Planctomycetota bacterium]|nr:MAG: hypothetical protein KatS3mg102_0165 [Planctomycetota bacterium]
MHANHANVHRSLAAGALAALLLAVPPALAQQEATGGQQPAEREAVLPARREPPAAAPPPPAAGGEQPAPAAPVAVPAAEQAEQARRREEISANYDATIEIYDGILQRQSTDTSALDRRIAANEELVERYRPLLARAEEQLRALQVDTMNRALRLKAERDRGELSEEAFRTQLAEAERRDAERRARLQDDVAFYRTELEAAERRLAELRAERQALARRLELGEAAARKPPAPGDRLLRGLLDTLDRLEVFPGGPRLTMDDNEACRGCNRFGPVGSRDLQ